MYWRLRAQSKKSQRGTVGQDTRKYFGVGQRLLAVLHILRRGLGRSRKLQDSSWISQRQKVYPQQRIFRITATTKKLGSTVYAESPDDLNVKICQARGVVQLLRL